MSRATIAQWVVDNGTDPAAEVARWAGLKPYALRSPTPRRGNRRQGSPWAADGLATTAEIARALGVTSATVSNYKARHPDFPPPAATYPRGALYVLADVLAWADRTGHRYGPRDHR